jgi:TonB family protein
MMAAWLTYCTLVAALLGGAAWVAERAGRAQGWSGRWPWAVALAGSLGLPLAAWLRPVSSVASSPAPTILPLPGAYVMESIPSLALQPAGSTWSADALLLWGWAAASGALLLYLVASGLRVRAEGRAWRRGEVDGVEVMVSERTGPAAVGLFRGRVVLPEWALSLDERLRRLLVLHEAEHVRAKDPQLAIAGLVACALMPWNVALWWQLARLRLAIEVDCDARVLRRSGDMKSYGALLLEVGQRRARLAVGLAESKSMLERRLRMMTRTTTGRRTVRALGLAALSGLVLAVACQTPAPGGTMAALETPGPETRAFADQTPTVFPPNAIVPVGSADRRTHFPPNAIEVQETPPRAESDTVPVYTPMTVPPRLQNADEVRQALQRHYPPMLRDAGISGTVNVWFFIDEEGVVQRTMVNESSGYDALDQAALQVASVMEFSPAYNREQRVPVWVAFDVTFEVGERQPLTEAELQAARQRQGPQPPVRVLPMIVRAPDQAQPLGEPLAQERGAGPVYTPMTQAPRLKNVGEVRAALQRHYPPLLRDARIGGTTNVWFFVDENGVVRRLQINVSSGYQELDQAALRVGAIMEFEPARNRDQKVPVWVAFDVTFEVQ